MALQLVPFPSSLPPSSSTTNPSTSAPPISTNTINLLSGRRRRLFSTDFVSLCTSTSTRATFAAPEESVEALNVPKTRLIAQNLPWTCTAEDVRKLFEKYGTVTDVEISMYNNTRNRGLAFVTMASEEHALAALNNLNSYEFEERTIKVEFARSLKKKTTNVPSEKYNVFVGNLGWRVRSKDLREIFDSSWKVLSADVIFQSNPRRSAGYGFVSFGSKEEAEAAISSFNGKVLMGRPIRMYLGKQRSGGEVLSAAEEQDVLKNEINEDADLGNQS